MSFIKKYQPNNLNDYEMEKELIDSLKLFINMDDLNILLYGNLNSCKTSIILTIVKEYYGDNYNPDFILQINSLKDNGISYLRQELKNFCQAIVNSKYKKIVILDDLDEINEQSQHVIRNYMDKYKHNVHFITSCRNLQKIIESLQSRLYIIKLKQPSNENLLNILNKITTKENINISNEASTQLITISNYSIKILINNIEKLKLLSNDITLDLINKACTNIAYNDFVQYLQYCIDKQLINAIKILQSLIDNGYNILDIFDNLNEFILITNMIDDCRKYKIIKLLCKYLTIVYIIHDDELELSLFTNNLIKLL